MFKNMKYIDKIKESMDKVRASKVVISNNIERYGRKAFYISTYDRLNNLEVILIDSHKMIMDKDSQPLREELGRNIKSMFNMIDKIYEITENMQKEFEINSK